MSDKLSTEALKLSNISEVGFPIQKSPDQRVLSPPRCLSQSATSFIASYRQDIPRMPF